MAGKPKPQEESGEGAPLWIISFADMVSLLMAFFVMLTTFSGFGPMESIRLRKVISATLAPDLYGGWLREQQPLGKMGRQMVATGQAEKGSEKPTLENPSYPGTLAESKSKDFRSQKVFIIESEKAFLGSGTAISEEGREFLDPLALLLSKIPGRIAVSEVGPRGPGDSPDTGIKRAVAVVEYLCDKGIPKNRCSVGTRATTPETNYKTVRILEITLLD